MCHDDTYLRAGFVAAEYTYHAKTSTTAHHSEKDDDPSSGGLAVAKLARKKCCECMLLFEIAEQSTNRTI